MAPLGPMPPNPVGWRECAVDTVFEFLALGFIVMRLWSRRLKKTPLDLSDVLVIAAWVCADKAFETALMEGIACCSGRFDYNLHRFV